MDFGEIYKSLGVELTKKGNRWKGNCPFPGHNDSTPSFVVYSDGSFYCFGCGKSGNLESFSNTGTLLKNKDYVINKIDVENATINTTKKYNEFRIGVENYTQKLVSKLGNKCELYDKVDRYIMQIRNSKNTKLTIEFIVKTKREIFNIVNGAKN